MAAETMMVDEEEVDLIDYLMVLLKHRTMIICLALVSVLSAAFFSYLMTPTYEVSRVLKIGQITPVGQIGRTGSVAPQERPLIDTREAVVEMVTDQRLLEKVRGKVLPEVAIQRLAKRITVDKRSPLVRYTVHGETPAEAVAVADAIAEGIIQRHARIFEESMAVKRRYEGELKGRIDVLTKEIQGMRKAFERIRDDSRIDAAAILLLEASLEERERNLAGLKHELQDVQLSNLPPRSVNTHVIAADAMPSKPVKPKTVLNMVLAGALSLFAGIFLAFFLEYWNRITRERARRTGSAVT